MIKPKLVFIFFLIYYISGYSQIVCPAKANNKSGYINIKGEWIIKPTFDSVQTFYKGFARVVKNNKKGLINSNGEIVLKIKYKDIGYAEDSTIIVRKNKTDQFFDLKLNKFIKGNFTEAFEFSEGLAAVQNNQKKWGFINKKGTLIIPFIYDEIDYKFERDSILVEKNGKKIILNRKGEERDTNYSFKKRKENFSFLGSLGKLGVISKQGDTILKPIYQSIEYFWYLRESKTFWYQKNNKYGIVDKKGDYLTKPIFDKIFRVSKKLFAIKVNDKWGFADNNGRLLINPKYHQVNKFLNGYCTVRLDNKWGAIDEKGEWIIPPKFEHLGMEFRSINSNFQEIN